MCIFVCVCIFEPQIYILFFNKLVSYKILIDYKNFQADFSDRDIWATLSALSYDPVLEYSWAINTFLYTKNLLDRFEPWNTHLNLISTK